MFQLMQGTWSAWLILIGVLSVFFGLFLSLVFPWRWKGPHYQFHATTGIASGFIGIALATALSRNWLTISIFGLLSGYVGSRLSSGLVAKTQKLWQGLFESEEKPVEGQALPASGMLFRPDWDARPRYESNEEEEGLFVGRREVLNRLTSDFISKRSGTILISGVRGVGKTALVERALLNARIELQDRYWGKALPELLNAPFWRPLDRRVLEVLPDFLVGSKAATASLPSQILKDAAAKYSHQPAKHFSKFRPTDQLIRRIHQASRSQLFVLKFNASDIGGAMAEPTENAVAGRPNVNPEKLLRALIRKLFMTCHSSRRTPEADILGWSLPNKKERNQFFDTLQNAYDKSVSKSYKEIISNNVNEAIKRSQRTASERKITIERVLGLVVCVIVGAIASWIGWRQGWKPLQWLTVGGGATIVATYFTWTRTSSSSREATFDRARQAQFSYEYDYSLAQMEYDLQAILGALHWSKNNEFDRYRCFTRKVIVFDELDKLEDPVRQLNDVITHFKNFFTLSDALFVFITDHEFYEHLAVEGAKAQLKRHYSPEHTFFTQKVYLRKPDFDHFDQTVYGFCDPRSLESRLRTAPLDETLTDFLLKEKPDLFSTLDQWSRLGTLTHLYIHRNEFREKDQIERVFEARGGLSNPRALARVLAAMIATGANGKQDEIDKIEKDFARSRGLTNPLAVAHIWLATVTAGKDGSDWKKNFRAAQGWENPEAVAFLYLRQSRFSDGDRNAISQCYNELKKRSAAARKYTSLDGIQFTLSDLARLLCFQTRNHYFDLYHLIYDYVGSYTGGLPILNIEDERFTREHRLGSRYQKMVELAFDYRRESHPSREYFNALLMESLYRIFDTRSSNATVKIDDILFSRQRVAESLQPSAPHVPKAGAPEEDLSKEERERPVLPTETNGEPLSPVSGREEEKINEAVSRLVRIAVARKAIRVDDSLKDRLLKGEIGLKQISNHTFTWEVDCEPVITQEGLDLEEYENDLVQFWEDNKTELDAFDQELGRAWAGVEMPSDSAARKMRDLISKLRNTAEGLSRRSMTISQYDASKLKADIGAPEAWVLATLDFVLERIRREGDADIADLSTLKEAWTTPFLLELKRPPSEIETIGKLPVRAIVRPKTTNCLMYLAAGAMTVDPKGLENALPKTDAYLFWHAPNIELSELGSPTVAGVPSTPRLSASMRFYSPAPESISKLLTDYALLASSVQLQQIAQKAKDDSYRDKSAGLSAGIELIAPLSGLGEFTSTVSSAAVRSVLTFLDDIKGAFQTSKPEDFWKAYGVEPTNWSQQVAAQAIAKNLIFKLGEQSSPPYLRQVLENTMLQSLPKEMPVTSAGGIFPSTEPNAVVRTLLQELIGDFVRRRLEDMHISDSIFQDLVRKEFSSWLLLTLQGIATTRKVELTNVLPSWSGDLEKERQVLIAKRLTLK